MGYNCYTLRNQDTSLISEPMWILDHTVHPALRKPIGDQLTVSYFAEIKCCIKVATEEVLWGAICPAESKLEQQVFAFLWRNITL